MNGSLGKQVLPDVDMVKYKGDDINTQDTLTLKEPPELLHMASPKLKDPPELLFQLSPNDPDKNLPNLKEKWIILMLKISPKVPLMLKTL